MKDYWRYADDMVILSDSKEYLHSLFGNINEYLEKNLKGSSVASIVIERNNKRIVI